MTAPAGNQQGIRPQETVERALAAARCDDCVVIADETSSAIATQSPDLTAASARSTVSCGVSPPLMKHLPRPC